ncbi:tRNA (adenosine(37)-N6)-threonylcarbamoyltransferase complex dimerization subunit type 1 TsaB [Longivirga aurantiaca]|uniref:tRNA (Adenosine(37)-N6)-threonylcarbamoyltransferase complex dimerization subunit type 1 TsaB n=1 Tax=Longivirga aurantiaca TaxID=1837743 RepID=A0ABW1SYW2_9ACTN
MLLLVMDTSSAVITAAVHDGDSVVGAAVEHGAQSHGELLAPVIARALAEAGARPSDLTRVCTGVGPGPFTGLRVGIVTARVMAEALSIPVHGICSLDVLAFQAAAESGFTLGGFAVATDARRKEVYLRTYDRGGRPASDPLVVKPGDVDTALAEGPVAGPGAWLYPEVFADAREPRELDGAAMAELVAARIELGSPLLDPEPLYLRRPDAVANTGRKRVTQP